MTDTAAGATPGTGAIPAHVYPFGPAWAPYRLPCPGANGVVTPRAVGIGFEGEPGDGATPPAGGDPPPKPPSSDPPKPPATGDAGEPDADGMTSDAGRRALQREREARAEVERQLAELRSQTATADEKREAQIKAAAAEERDTFWMARIRTAEVRSALRAKGLTDDKQLNLAANAPEFASLKVTPEDGTVADLGKTVDQFVKDYPPLFADGPKPGGGQPTRGAQGGAGAAGDRPKTLGEAIKAGLSAS